MKKILKLCLKAQNLVPFSDTFSGATMGVRWTGATWSISSGKALNTPATLGDTLVTNGSMEAGDPPTGWNAALNATLDGAADERTGGAGAQSLGVINGAGYGQGTQALTIAAHKWLRISAWHKLVSGTGYVTQYKNGATYDNRGDSATWANTIGSVKTPSANDTLIVGNITNTIGHESRYDDIAVQEFTLSELIASVESKKANVNVSVKPTIATTGKYSHVGVIARLDNAATPANFLIAYITVLVTTYKCYLDKCVAGTYTPVISATTITYAAGAALEIRCSGSSIEVYYNTSQVGTTQTVSDAGILGNTLHGMFSTSALNTFDDFSVT